MPLPLAAGTAGTGVRCTGTAIKNKYYDMTNKFLLYFLLDISGYCR